MSIPLLFGPYGSPSIEFIDQFNRYGANTVWFHGFNPEAFEVCQKYQINPCVEFKTFRGDFNTRPEIVPIGVDGQPIRYGDLVQGVCLSQTAFLEETENNLLEGIKTFQPVGIWLDYLTYAGWFEMPKPDLQESCFCPDCIADFCFATGIDADTSKQILSATRAQWTRHKCERIAKFAAHYAGLIRSWLPECIIGAYMCPWDPEEFDGALTRIFAQDYALLAPVIDVFTPLIYVKKSGRTSEWGREFLDKSAQFVPHDRKVQLILDAQDFPDSLVSVGESSNPSWGVQVFAGAQIFNDLENANLFREVVDRMHKRVS
jgi:hypothetical protein